MIEAVPDLPHTRFARSSRPGCRECAMTQPSSETCLHLPPPSPRLQTLRNRPATTRHRHFPSKAASRDQANDLTIRTCDLYLPAGIPMPLHCVSSSASTPRSAEFRKPFPQTPLRERLQRWNESILLSSPHLLFFLSKKPPRVLSWTPLFSDSSYVAHTSRRPWQRRPYMAHNRLRACVKFRGFERNSRLFGAFQRARVPQLHISSTAPLLPAKLKPRFS